MPVKSEIMLSSHIDNSCPWGDSIFPVGLFEDDNFLDMRFLESAVIDESFNSLYNDNIDFTDLLQTPETQKYQIRNHDCMWSGTCVDENHPSKKKGMCHRFQPSTSIAASAASTSIASQLNQSDAGTTQRATVECVNSRFTSAKAIMTPTLMKSITPNSNSQSSTLSRVNTNTALMRVKIEKDIKVERDFESIINTSSLRPDTPHSLGEDVADYRHNIDLTPCPSGNRMKFSDQNSHRMINMLREHLEDLNDQSNYVNMFKNQKPSQSDINELLTDITFLSDYEENGDESSGVDMDEDMTDESSSGKEITYKKHHQQATTSTTRTISQFEFISDHSYTRKGSKEDFSSLGVQTPSDSEEEDIDVVGLKTKNLPTNPSARDRRALQTTVAQRIARSKQANQHRRVSSDDSISSSTSTLSSKGSTPIKIGSQTPQRFVFSSSSHLAASRKRKDAHKYRYQQSKKQRLHSKNMRLQQQQQQQQQVDPDEAETIEKRNLHNNMERQRRIGLKNLFEELKRQIPTLREKERAPKVNILREAAVYCTKLRRDEDLHNELAKKNARLMNKLRNLKSSMAAQQRRNY